MNLWIYEFVNLVFSRLNEVRRLIRPRLSWFCNMNEHGYHKTEERKIAAASFLSEHRSFRDGLNHDDFLSFFLSTMTFCPHFCWLVLCLLSPFPSVCLFAACVYLRAQFVDFFFAKSLAPAGKNTIKYKYKYKNNKIQKAKTWQPQQLDGTQNSPTRYTHSTTKLLALS